MANYGIADRSAQVSINKKMREIHDRLKPLITKTCPFAVKPKIKDVTWVKPETVCEVRFLEWTADGILRAPVFVGLREDKNASEVVRENPASDPEADEPDEPEEEAEAASDVETSPFLDLVRREAVVDIDGHNLKFSNLDKVFYPKDGWKKRDLARLLRSRLDLASSAPERPASVTQALSERHPRRILLSEECQQLISRTGCTASQFKKAIRLRQITIRWRRIEPLSSIWSISDVSITTPG